MAALGLRCCARAVSCYGTWGPLFAEVNGPLTAVASPCRARAIGAQASAVAAHELTSCGSWTLGCRLSSCGAWAQLLRRMWDLPGPGIDPMSPALAGGSLTTAPTGKPDHMVFILQFVNMVYHID